eukprot:scaffold26906_cov32-Tisochrysis_lutea.AAC.2
MSPCPLSMCIRLGDVTFVLHSPRIQIDRGMCIHGGCACASVHAYLLILGCRMWRQHVLWRPTSTQARKKRSKQLPCMGQVTGPTRTLLGNPT